MLDTKYNELSQVTPVTVQLNRWATIMETGSNDHDKLTAATHISRLGQEIVKLGGIDGLKEIHAELDSDRKRTVELQWFGLTAEDGRQWLP
ncbi:hypothetical protein O4H61_19480 [Roseovarius aestuarii]|nr:hypothetical protein [Roseovarius aestuarii]